MKRYVPLLVVALSACPPTRSEQRLDGGVDGGVPNPAFPASAGRRVDALVSSPSTRGNIPNGMPQRLAIGLTEGNGQTWMRNSGVKWDYRYRYLVKGWVNNWGYSTTRGAFAMSYMRECDAAGFRPAFQWYQGRGESPAGEGNFYEKTRNATTMRGYWSDYKVLLQQAKTFGKHVLILLEADGYAYMAQQSGFNPNAYSAVAATGLPELQGLPNTVAGWGMAFLRMREAVGASNVVLGVHVSVWATGTDLMYGSGIGANLNEHVQRAYSFLGPLGLQPNMTGKTYDILVGDPIDRDVDFHRLVNRQDRRWSVDGPVSSMSYNRYAEWLRLWNQASGKRWVLWQLPLGNSLSRNVRNDGTPRSGWQDNRTEYFFAGSAAEAHRQKFWDAGVIALLFGEGATGQSTARTAVRSDGKSMLAEYARQYLANAINVTGLMSTTAPSSVPQDAGMCLVPCGTCGTLQ